MAAEMAKMMHRTAAIFLILAGLPTSINSNKKYVKGEVIAAEDLCQLRRFFLDTEKQTTAVDDVHVMLLEEKLTDMYKTKPKATVHGLERSLLGNGAHREVNSGISVELHLGPDRPDTSVANECELVLLHPLCDGVFADPFQLNRLQQQQAVKYAQIYGDVDLEQPARNSFRSILELHQSQ